MLLLVLDGAVGLWSSLHAPSLQHFFISQIPVAGVAGVIWGFLGDRLKGVVADRISAVLQKRVAYWSVAAFTILFFSITLFRSTVQVRALDPSGSEVLFVAAGGPRDLSPAIPQFDSAMCELSPARDSARPISESARASAAADSGLLNRLTTPVDFSIWTLPIGRDVWFYTPTHASARPVRVWPWWRRSLQYPEEFDEIAKVYALPLFPIFKGLPTGCPVALILREQDANGTLLASDTVSSVTGLQLAYRDSIPLDTLARRRWEDSLRLRARHSILVDAERAGGPVLDSLAIAQLDASGAGDRAALVSRWAKYRLVNTRRPLHVGERIYWEVRGLHRVVVASGEVSLAHATDIFLGTP